MPVKSAHRTLEVLETLGASQSPLTLGELASRLGIPKSSLHGILRTLTQRHWVTVDEAGRRFSLGLRALLVGASYVESNQVVVQLQPILDWLSSESSGEVVHLARLDGPDVVYLAKRESAHALRLFSAVGRRLPAHATALGKALLARRSDDEVVRLLQWPLAPLTGKTITKRYALLQELSTIRKTGYAVDNEESADGVRCLAVALETTDPPTDAISFSIPVFRLTADHEARAVSLLVEAKQRVARLYSIGSDPADVLPKIGRTAHSRSAGSARVR
jgi:DNA-binding IclR family transcriptional regulator